MVNSNSAGNGQPRKEWRIGDTIYTNFADYDKAQEEKLRTVWIRLGFKAEDWDAMPPATAANYDLWTAERKRIDQPLGKPYRVVSAAELDASNDRPRYLIPGILAAGEAGGIYGPAKSLKTSLAADLLISLASGTPFLGRFPVPEPGKVLFCSCRAGLAGMQSLARRICRERGLSLASLENFALSSDLADRDRGVDLRAFRALLAREKPVCVVIDPVGLAVSADKRRDRFALSDLFGQLGEVCHSLGIALLVVHPCKRSTKLGRPATLDDVAGNGFAELSAQWLLVSRRRAYESDSGHHELWLSAGNGAGHQGLWALDVDEGSAPPVPDEGPIAPVDPDSRTWKTTLCSVAWAEAQADEQEAQRKEDRRQRRWAATCACHRARVLKHLIPYPEGRTANGIRDTLGINGVRMTQILEQLIREGLVETDEIEHAKRTEIVYRLAVEDDLSVYCAGGMPRALSGHENDMPTETGGHATQDSAGSSENVRGAREKSGPETCADLPDAPSPPAPLPRGERGEECAAALPSDEKAPQAAEKSGPDATAEDCGSV